MIKTHPRKIGVWLSALLLVLSSVGVGLNAATPAGTQIRNQASATYTDSAGRSQTSTSNEVINIVAAIYSLEILPNQADEGLVASFTGAPALSQATAAGNIVYYSYYLTNQSNVADRFQLRYIQSTTDDADASRVAIYVDVNGDGQVDPGDLKLVDSNDPAPALAASDFADSVFTPVVQPGNTLRLVVAVTVPSTSNTGNIDIDIDARSEGDDSVTDEVGNFNRTTVTDGKGIIAAYKSVDVQSAGPGDTVTYTIQGSNVGAANVVGREFDTTTSDIQIDRSADGTYQTETGILIIDNLDDSRISNFVDIESIDFGDPATAASFGDAEFLFGYDDGGTLRFTRVNTAVLASPILGQDPDRIAIFFPSRTLSPGQAFSASFAVDVEENSVFTGANALALIENTATVYYNDGDDDAETTTNAAQTQIDNRSSVGNLGVEFSPYTFLDGATASNVELTQGTVRGSQQHPEVDNTNTNAYSLIADNNTTTADNRNAGELFAIPLTVTNSGGATDTYNIAIGANTLLAGYEVFFFQSDGITPLGDTNSDGIRDTGPIANGASRDIVVKILIPGNAAEAANAGLLTLTATSATDSSITSNTEIEVLNVRPAGVDIAVQGETYESTVNTVQSHNPGATGDGDSSGNSVIAGQTLSIPVDVRNVRAREAVLPAAANGVYAERRTGSPDTYTLSWSSGNPGLTDTWTVNFFRRDIDGNPTGQPISDTRDLNPDELSQLVAVILAPSSALAGEYFISLTATSTNNSIISDTMFVAVTVSETPIIEIDPDNTATVLRGGTYTFRHTLFNLGNTSEDVTLTLNSTDSYQVVFVDSDGTVLGETLSGGDYNTSPGDEVEVFVRVFIPQNAPVGSSSIFTVTATSAGNAPSDTAVNIVQVIDGNLQLTKSSSVVFDPGNGRILPTSRDADPTGAIDRFNALFPLRYTTEYSNLGSQPITDVVIIDQIPANTRLVVANVTNTAGAGLLPTPIGADVAEPTSTGGAVSIEYSTDGGISWSSVTPAAAADGSNSTVTHIRYVLDAGSLAPGVSGTVTFDVLVD